MEQENTRKETFLAAFLLLAGSLILWKGYSYEPTVPGLLRLAFRVFLSP